MTIGVLSVLGLTLYLQFRGDLTPTTSVTMVAARAGLVMDPGSKVTYNGVQIGRVSSISEITRELSVPPESRFCNSACRAL